MESVEQIVGVLAIVIIRVHVRLQLYPFIWVKPVEFAVEVAVVLPIATVQAM